MAIAFDNATDGGLVNPGTSLTYAHTCTGSNLILFVTAFGDTSAGDHLSGVTYNTVAMTLVDKIFTAGDRWCYLFYLIAPATGAHNVVLSSDGTSIAIASHAASYTGALQSGQPDSHNTGSQSSGTTLTISTTVVAANCWLVSSWRLNSVSGTAGTGTTQREGSSGLYTADSNGTVGTGSQSLQYNLSGGGLLEGVVASFAPAAATGGTASVFLLKG